MQYPLDQGILITIPLTPRNRYPNRPSRVQMTAGDGCGDTIHNSHLARRRRVPPDGDFLYALTGRQKAVFWYTRLSA